MPVILSLGGAEPASKPDLVPVHHGQCAEACARQLHRGLPTEFEFYHAFGFLKLIFTRL
jgi:hypothetical protein